MRIVWTLVAGFGIAVGESGLGIGMFLPGETAIIVLAATLPTWQLSLTLAVLVAVGACLGDHVGYLLGRRYGLRLRETRAVRRIGVEHFDRATDVLQRRGAAAVFGTRLVPLLRTVTPAAAGVAGLRYRSFVLASLAGSATWSAVYVGGGSVVAASLATLDGWVGRLVGLGVVMGVVVIAPLVVVRVVGGVRRVVVGPDLSLLEESLVAPRERRAAFSPLIGEFQLRR